MWFGDLVTMRWWNGIWLNEAFATFMELLAVDAYRPDWERWSQFLRSRSIALEVDALESTRSIEYPVRSPDDASGMFDILTYTKGAAVLRMLEQYLGAERFRDGIRRYLDEHRFGNTETHDLWDAIEKATGEPVRRIMDGWIWQGGYPLVSARLRDGKVELGQRRYLISGEDDDTVWDVPLLVRTSGGDRTRADRARRRVDRGARRGSGRRERRRPRVRPRRVRRRAARTAHRRTCARSRPTSARSSWTTRGRRSSPGVARAVDFCRFAASFAEETELPVWQSLLQGLAWCERFLTDGPREHFRSWIRGLLWPAIERIGWEPREGERDLDKPLRGALMAALASWAPTPRRSGWRWRSNASRAATARSTPRWWRPRSRSWPRAGPRRTSSGTSRRSVRRGRRRRSSGTCTRSRTSGTPCSSSGPWR